MDPREMFNQIRRDCASSRWIVVVVAASLAAGIACWIPVVSARISRPSVHHPAISVLSDPFDRQTQ